MPVLKYKDPKTGEVKTVGAPVYDAGSKVYMTKVTLPASGWNAETQTQTVAVSGILADDTKQLIQAVPAPASMGAATDTGVYCSGQGNGSLTFTCEHIPTEAIVFNVSYQDATYLG